MFIYYDSLMYICLLYGVQLRARVQTFESEELRNS
jgi:hypothetical protein